MILIAGLKTVLVPWLRKPVDHASDQLAAIQSSCSPHSCRCTTLCLPAVLQLLPPVEVQQRDAAGTGSGRGGHRMELRGLLPPWVLDRMCAVLQDSQEGQFQVCAPAADSRAWCIL